MVMFSEDVTALDFDNDEEGNDVGGGGNGSVEGDGGSEVDVSDAVVDDDDDASLYPSSPELGARTSNFLRDQVLLLFIARYILRQWLKNTGWSFWSETWVADSDL